MNDNQFRESYFNFRLVRYFGMGEKFLLNLVRGQGVLVEGENKQKLQVIPLWERI